MSDMLLCEQLKEVIGFSRRSASQYLDALRRLAQKTQTEWDERVFSFEVEVLFLFLLDYGSHGYRQSHEVRAQLFKAASALVSFFHPFSAEDDPVGGVIDERLKNYAKRIKSQTGISAVTDGFRIFTKAGTASSMIERNPAIVIGDAFREFPFKLACQRITTIGAGVFLGALRRCMETSDIRTLDPQRVQDLLTSGELEAMESFSKVGATYDIIIASAEPFWKTMRPEN